MTNAWSFRFVLTFLLLLLAKSACWAAGGYVNVASPSPDQEICVEDKLVISGQFMLETDDTPLGSADPALYCHPGARRASLNPSCCSSPTNYTSLHARLTYQINGGDHRQIRNVVSYYGGYGIGYDQIGELLNFSIQINRSSLLPGEHQLTVNLQVPGQR